MKENILLKSHFDNEDLHCIFYSVSQPKAIVQIIHGMKEHQNRYEPLAAFLNEHGFSVITSDLRGHGKYTDEKQLGYMGKKAWKALVQDQITILNYLHLHHEQTPIYLFAHSMGTIIGRNLIQSESDSYQKIVFSSAPAYQSAAHAGVFLADIIGLFHGNHYVSKMLEHLTLSPFSKAIQDRVTENDWISVNPENVGKYNEDPYCGIPFTVSAYKALYHLIIQMNQPKRYQMKKKDVPILFLAGQEDPCTLYEKGLHSSIRTLEKAGYENIRLKTYPQMRHEILNEKDHLNVYQDILEFFQ